MGQRRTSYLACAVLFLILALIAAVLLLLVNNVPARAAVIRTPTSAPTMTPMHTATYYPTYTPGPTYTPEPTIVVTATPEPHDHWLYIPVVIGDGRDGWPHLR